MSMNALPEQELLEKLFENLHMPVAYMDKEFNFVKVNQAYAQADNKTPDHFIGLNHFSLFPNEENETIFSNVVKTRKIHYCQAKPFEYEHNPERGVTHWDWTLTPVFSNSQEVSGVLLMLLNVTEHVETQIEIQQEKLLSERILDTAGELIIVLNEEGKICRFNKKCELVSGYRFEELDDRYAWDVLLPHENISCEKRRFFEMVTMLKPSLFDGEWKTKNGKIKNIRWNCTILDSPESKDKYIVCIGSDITERIETEKRIKKLSQIVDQINDAVISTDISGHIVSWNQGAEQIYGYSEKEIIGKHISILFVADENNETNFSFIDPILRKGSHTIETKMKQKRGEIFYGYASISLLHDEEGKTIGIICYAKNITERKTIENELSLYRKRLEFVVQERTKAYMSAKEEADLANRNKSEFLSRMSHELRTPLNSIMGFGQLMEMDELSERCRDYLGEMMQASNQLYSMINDLLDISRIETGTLKFHYEQVSIVDAINGSISLVQNQARELDIELRSEIQEIETVTVYIDPVRFKETLVNLLTNAIKYNKRGGNVTIAGSFNVSKSRIRIKVIDTGVGIKLESQFRLFELYNRLGAEDSKIEGSGIGLYLSKKLINAMGGAIGFESKYGEGSTFWIEYPIFDCVAIKVDSCL